MKCQNCGKSEVNFHYSSNINGCVTQTNLCSECAAKSGYDFEQMFNAESVFGEFFPVFGRMRGFMPPPMMWFDAFPVAVRPRLAEAARQSACECGCETAGAEQQPAEVNEEMKKRREINMLREQMRLAAEKDDFEKAIELRTKIKEMET